MDWREFNAVCSIQKVIDSVKNQGALIFIQPINDYEGKVCKIYVSVEHEGKIGRIITGRTFILEKFISDENYINVFESFVKRMISNA